MIKPRKNKVLPAVLFVIWCSMLFLALPVQAAQSKYSVNIARKTLFVGEKQQIQTRGIGVTYRFKSSNKKVLTVSGKKGLLKARSKGTATITVTARWKSGRQTKTVVKQYKLKVKKLKLKTTSFSLTTGQSAKLSFNQPTGTRKIVLTAQNPDFVDIQETSLIGRYPGKTKVTVRVGDSLLYTVSVKVSVTELRTQYEKLLINANGINAAFSLKQAAEKEIGTEKLYYTLADPSKGRIDGGVYRALKPGSNTIAVTGNGKRKHFVITGYVWGAHRGYLDMYPENTLDAFMAAGLAGAAMCETDLQVTSDGEIVCLHNATVTHMTNGTGYVSNKTYDELRKLTIDNGNNVSGAEHLYIPKFSEYLKVCKQYHMIAIIELKDWSKLSEEQNRAAMKSIYRQIISANMQNQCFLISFHGDQLKRFHDANGDTGIPYGALNAAALSKGNEYQLPNLTNYKKTKFGNYTGTDYSPIVGKKNKSYTQY